MPDAAAARQFQTIASTSQTTDRKQPEITKSQDWSQDSVWTSQKILSNNTFYTLSLFKISNKTMAFMPQAHRHLQLLWSSPLLFYWRTLLSQLQAAWAACPCPGLCSIPRKIKKKKKNLCVYNQLKGSYIHTCLLAHTSKKQNHHHHRWPHSLSVSNTRLVWMEKNIPRDLVALHSLREVATIK